MNDPFLEEFRNNFVSDDVLNGLRNADLGPLIRNFGNLYRGIQNGVADLWDTIQNKEYRVRRHQVERVYKKSQCCYVNNNDMLNKQLGHWIPKNNWRSREEMMRMICEEASVMHEAHARGDSNLERDKESSIMIGFICLQLSG